MFHDLGLFDFLAMTLAAIGALLSLLTFGLLSAKRTGAVRVVGLSCVVIAGGVLALGAVGHALGMTAVMAAVGNAPFEAQGELLLTGTREARVSLFIAMIGAALPLLAGSIAVVVARLRVGMALALFVAVGLAMTALEHQRPLPPGKPVLAQVEGLQLASSTAQRSPGAQPLIALTAEGLWVDGSKVAGVEAALTDARVREKTADVLPLSVDARVSFAALVDVLEAAGRANLKEFDLVVRSPAEELAAIRVRNAASVPSDPQGKPSLNLTLRVTATDVQVSAVGGALEPLPLDWPQVQAKLQEIKANFPGEVTLRITAEPGVSMEVLVQALDATRETAQRRLLFPDAVVGRFESPVVARPTEADSAQPSVSPRGSATPSAAGIDSAEIDPAKLASWVRARTGPLQECYEKELVRNPRLKGKVVVRFSIMPSGATGDVEIEENTLANDAVASCLMSVIRRWVLPFKPTTAVPVAYPFVFAPAS